MRGGWLRLRVRRRWLLGTMLGVTVLGAGSASLLVVPSMRGDDPEPPAAHRALRAEVVAPRPTVAAPARDVPRVLIIGDSIADQQGSHAAVALRAAGVQTRVAAIWGGGLFTRDQYDMGRTNPEPPPGSMMHNATAEVAEFDPDVVAVYSNHNYWPPFPRDASGRDIAYGSPQFAEMVHTQLTELVRRVSAGGAKVFLVEPVPEAYGRSVMDNAIWRGYLEVAGDLGVGVIESGSVLASPTGDFVPSVTDCAGAPADVRPPDDLLHLSYLGAGRVGTSTAQALAEALGLPAAGVLAPSEAPAALVPMGASYRVVTCEGATFPFGASANRLPHDAVAQRPPGDPVMHAATAAGEGMWSLTAGGRVLAYGDASFHGDLGPLPPGERAVGIAPTASGRGYWIATSSGRVEAFGDAPRLGGLAGEAETVVALEGAPDGRGYWLLAASGRVAAFGGVAHHGDLREVVGEQDGSQGGPPDGSLAVGGALGDDGGATASPAGDGSNLAGAGATAAGPGDARPAIDLVGMAAHPSGEGYWLLDRAGNVYGFGAAEPLGTAAGQDLLRLVRFGGLSDYEVAEVPPEEMPTHAVSMLPTRSGNGYWILLANGAVCRFGDAAADGSLHRAEIDELMVFVHLPYYGNGPCSHGVGFGSIDGLEVLVRPGAPIPVPQL